MWLYNGRGNGCSGDEPLPPTHTTTRPSPRCHRSNNSEMPRQIDHMGIPVQSTRMGFYHPLFSLVHIRVFPFICHCSPEEDFKGLFQLRRCPIDDIWGTSRRGSYDRRTALSGRNTCTVDILTLHDVCNKDNGR